MPWSLLDVTGITIPEFAKRSIVMTLEPVAQSIRQRRTINAELKDVSNAAFFKRRVTISCTDHESPILHDVAPGTLIGVKCVQHLGTNALDTDGEQAQLELNMMVETYNITRNEREADTGWQIVANEV